MTEGHPTTPMGTAEEHIMLPECPPAPRASYKALDWNLSAPTLSLAPSLDDNDNSSGEISSSSSPPSLKRSYDGVITTPELLLKPRPSAPVGIALFASRSMDVSSFHQICVIRRNKKSKMTKSPSFSRAAWISWPNQEGPRMKYHVLQIRIVLAATLRRSNVLAVLKGYRVWTQRSSAEELLWVQNHVNNQEIPARSISF